MKDILSSLAGSKEILALVQEAFKGNKEVLEPIIDWAYNMAIGADIPGIESANQLAIAYRDPQKGIEENVDKLIKDYRLRAGLMGAATSIGGLGSLPINFLSTTVLQMRMAAAIAVLGGWNLEDERVKRALILCALGSKAITQLRKSVIKGAMDKFSARLVGKWLGKGAPFIGMVVGGAIDLAATQSIGKVAKQAFITDVPRALKEPVWMEE